MSPSNPLKCSSKTDALVKATGFCKTRQERVFMQGKRGLRNLEVSQLLYHRDLNPGEAIAMAMMMMMMP